MKKIISLLISLLLISSVCVIPSFATDSSECNINYVTGEVTVNITLSDVRSGIFIPFFDLNPTYTGEDIIPVSQDKFEKEICHYNYLATDKDGVITYTYVPENARSGNHNLFYISPVTNEVVNIPGGYKFYDDSDMLAILEEFNNATSSQEVKEKLEIYYYEPLGIETLDTENIDTISACIFRDKTLNKFTKVAQIRDAYNMGISVSKINTAQDDFDFLFILEQEGYYDDFTSLPSYTLIEYLSEDEDLPVVYDTVLANDYVHFYDIEKTFTSAVVLKIVEKAKNTTYVESAILKNTDYLDGLKKKNLESLNKKAGLSSVSSKIINKTFDSIELFVQKVNSLVSQELNRLSQGSDTSSSDSFDSSGGFSSIAQNPDTQINTPSSVVFKDMANSMWASEAVGTLVELGIINGRTKNTFAPDDYITREEFVKIIVEAFNLDASSDINFTDVSSDSWCYEYVKRAVASDLIKGISSTQFGKGEYITREDIAVILQRALSKQVVLNQAQSSFADNGSISSYSSDSVSKLVNAGIITGFSDNTFRPKDNATRAQAAVMVYRALNFKGGIK